MRTVEPQVFILWIKEVQVANSIDELVPSRSITGQHNFPDFDVLDAKIASALKKFINTQSIFRERASFEDSFEEPKYETVRELAHLVSMIL